MNDAFQFGKNSAYELKSGNDLERTDIQTVGFGSESIITLGAKIWDFISFSGDKSMKISFDFQEKNKELDSHEYCIVLVALAGSLLYIYIYIYIYIYTYIHIYYIYATLNTK